MSEGIFDGATLACLRTSACPTVGLSLYEDGLELSTRTCCLLSVGASARKGKTVALTINGKDYFTAIPVKNHEGTVFLVSFRWGLGRLTWCQTGEFYYPIMGAWEVDSVGWPAENTKAWAYKATTFSVLEQVFAGKGLVPCGLFSNWLVPSRLVRRAV